MPKLSAGLLLYRVTDGAVEVLIGHPGGPFWARKDDGAWSIPKGDHPQPVARSAAHAARVSRRARLSAARGPSHRLRAAQAAERKDRHRVRRLRRSGPGRSRQQHLRGGMAEGIREFQGVSRNRPGWLVFRGPGAVETAYGSTGAARPPDGTSEPGRLRGGCSRRRRTGRVSIALIVSARP